MNFRAGRRREEPEINFVPLIDLLLVILIFLTVTTTYAKFDRLQLELPLAGAQTAVDPPASIVLAIGADGRYALEGKTAESIVPAALAGELTRMAAGRHDPALIIHADGRARHQAVVAALEAARHAGIARVSFAARHGNAVVDEQ